MIERGEARSLQLKERVNDVNKLATELVAFSNAVGGLLELLTIWRL